MKYDFHVHDALRVEYRVLAGGPLAPGCARIERETRSAGGGGVVAACALAKWGARVLLTGNRLGDDAHGQFLRRELQNVPNLGFETRLEAGFETPYAILIQNDAAEVSTLLSATAYLLELEAVASPPDVFRLPLDGPEDAEDASGQSYAALLQSLHRAALCFCDWKGVEAAQQREFFATKVVNRYREAFGGLSAIPKAEEIAAFGFVKG